VSKIKQNFNHRNARSLLANRLSFYLDLHGPSFNVDTACSSSMFALDMAYNSFKNGECDSAIVGGANFLMSPEVSLQFARLGVLAPNGFCKF
jgi:fatty acid synthase, animal type